MNIGVGYAAKSMADVHPARLLTTQRAFIAVAAVAIAITALPIPTGSAARRGFLP